MNNFKRQEAGGNHILKPEIEARTPLALCREIRPPQWLGFVSRAMRLDTIPLLNWALYSGTLVLINTSNLLPPALYLLPFLVTKSLKSLRALLI
ncbi:MAG: hypothetical protein RMX96_29500 [Nostoc sp. ChiSLP02]|nr:hypothetical protein [Nostoc sp. DedSLP05]MDZ8101060.1 hypothetical protein [Nostoc sp. DedSLP01]MDZ8188976.1 hypothetical protein [Nostoc sp. ChiSLP02]